MGRKPKNLTNYKVPDKTYVHIEAFMVNDLHLSGNELIIYAVIYGFSQDGASWFTGSRKYLSGWCQTTEETVTYNLRKLMEKGFIQCHEKQIHGVTFKDYRAVLDILGVGGISVPQDEKPVPADEKPVPATVKPTPHTIGHTIDTNHSHTNRGEARFKRPTLEEVKAYCKERKNGIDPQHFIDYQDARGWRLKGGQLMKDWKATIRTWERFERQGFGRQDGRTHTLTQEDIQDLGIDRFRDQSNATDINVTEDGTQEIWY